ncbi:MAG: hypothetical protein R6U61_09230 [Thermoplasmata archaeon]
MNNRFREGEEIIKDTEKGAAELALDVSYSLLELDEAEAENYLKKVIEGRYTMTPLLNLANRVFLSMERDENLDQRITTEIRWLENAPREASKNMKTILRDSGYNKICTLSYSSTVIRSLSQIDKVHILESRPLMEGRKTAEKLVGKGVDVHLWTDASMSKALSNSDAVVLGADSLSINGFVNKIGSYPLTLTAMENGIPVYVVCDTSKVLPERLPISHSELHDQDEVWKTSLDIKIHNDYFELSSWKGEKLVTENGLEDISYELFDKELSDMLLEYHPMV